MKEVSQGRSKSETLRGGTPSNTMFEKRQDSNSDAKKKKAVCKSYLFAELLHGSHNLWWLNNSPILQ